jgi:hypothetical protein
MPVAFLREHPILRIYFLLDGYAQIMPRSAEGLILLERFNLLPARSMGFPQNGK